MGHFLSLPSFANQVEQKRIFFLWGCDRERSGSWCVLSKAARVQEALGWTPGDLAQSVLEPVNRGQGLSTVREGGGNWFKVTTVEKSFVFFKSCFLL